MSEEPQPVSKTALPATTPITTNARHLIAETSSLLKVRECAARDLPAAAIVPTLVARIVVP
jgi:hypothetical protein